MNSPIVVPVVCYGARRFGVVLCACYATVRKREQGRIVRPCLFVKSGCKTQLVEVDFVGRVLLAIHHGAVVVVVE